jgi:Alcohol acetyltransferase
LVREADIFQLEFYAQALIDCIQQHSFLSATIQDVATNNPVFIRLNKLDLSNHFRVLKFNDSEPHSISSQQDGEVALLSRALERIHNDPEFSFTNVDSKPAWALDVLSLSMKKNSTHFRVFISFTYSHSHGDGMSGIIFHRTFHTALQQSLESKPIPTPMTFEPSRFSLIDYLDVSAAIPLSWSYLLPPVLGTFLPGFLITSLGIPTNLTGSDEKTWTGNSTFTESSKPKATTTVEVIRICPPLLRCMLAECKRNGAKLTPFLNHSIAQAISKAIAALDDTRYIDINFIATTPVNLRHAFEVPQDVMGNYGGVAHLRYEFATDSRPLDESSWEGIRSQGKKLAHVATNMNNQAIGLLRYVSDFCSWMQSQIGRPRDCSWELSNLGSVASTGTVAANQTDDCVRMERVVFSQPASPLGAPLTFSAVSVKDGELIICIGWQIGALNLSRKDEVETIEQQERRFVKQVKEHLMYKLEQLTTNKET